MYYVGIDWADRHHDISVVNLAGKEKKRFRITHNLNGFNDLVVRLRFLKAEIRDVAFCIERPQGLLIEFLLKHGYVVYPINPKSAERYRDRHSTSSKKDDGFDAFVLADALRTDINRFKPLVPDSELSRELKMLVQDREHLVHTKTKILNQLTACLKEYYPTGLEIFSKLQNDVTICFLKNYSTSGSLDKMTFKEFKKFMNSNKYPWKMLGKTPKSLFQEIQSMKPFLSADPAVVKAKSRLMLALLGQLETLVSQVKQYDGEIEKLMNQHPDNDIFTSLPGSGKKVSAKLSAYFGEDRKRFDSYESVQRLAGTAPVTKSSGNMHYVHWRWACQKNFRNALTQFAFSSLGKSIWARKYYQDKRDKGKTHSAALRALANKWVKIIYTLWKNRRMYKEEVFLASRQIHMLLNDS